MRTGDHIPHEEFHRVYCDSCWTDIKIGEDIVEDDGKQYHPRCHIVIVKLGKRHPIYTMTR